MPSILTSLDLTPPQRQAAELRDAPIVVTAGAGSGKTRALVGRYLSLLEGGLPLRSIIAITFTDKAAREMRTRVRRQIGEWVAMDAPRPDRWQAALADLDAARIGTIHSLCAEILRAHPVEAVVDPRFEVLEEGLASTLKSEAIDAALAWASADPAAAGLFGLLKENGLRQTLDGLIEKRLDAEALLSADWRAAWIRALSDAAARFVDDAGVIGAIETLRDPSAVKAGGDKLAANVAALLQNWSAYESARAAGDWDSALVALFNMRREGMAVNVGKAGAAKDAVKLLRQAYDATLIEWLGDAKENVPPRWPLDALIADALPQVRRVFDRMLAEYRRLKDERQSLDFDDLEGGAVELLAGHESVRKRWQSEVKAVLVDEFQDTNERQRRIVYALTGFDPMLPARQPGTLFVVGDAKQSIYRFRGADVTVFRRVQDDVQASGGQSLSFDQTFRAHKPLVETTNALLEPILGAGDPARPFLVPFAPLKAKRKSPREGMRKPFVEFCLGVGGNAEEGRSIAADALAARLMRMRAEEGIEWGDVALLFRASTTFGVYEDALERAGIPFVTVAGRGFYDRPEVRDLLNALVAVSDPSDDLAMAGLLRSPAIGLSDATIYSLRWEGDQPRPLGHVVANFKFQMSNVKGEEAARIERARKVISELNGWAGRATVAQVLKRFLDATGYLAMLRLADEHGAGERLRRNVEKLLTDAHKSQLVSVTDFLDYVRALRVVDVRESEAPVEAGGAVQLMTVHKAKGLEFPVVVIADAAHKPGGGTKPVMLDADLGVLLQTCDEEGSRPVMWQLAARREADRQDAEDRRLLYVAATRAQEKLVVSGHASLKKDGALSLRGWLARLGDVTELAAITFDEELAAPRTIDLQFGVPCTLHASSPEVEAVKSPGATAPPAGAMDLVPRLTPAGLERADGEIDARKAEPPRRVWRVVPHAKRPTGPAWVVGKLVHAALRRWRFPDAPDFEVFLYPHALEAGLTDQVEIANAMRQARRLLERFRAHPLWADMNAAERWHELPYAVADDVGVIDVLYRNGDGTWTIADFKTDEIRHADQAARQVAENKYDEQLRRYADAVEAQLGIRPRTILVFLNVAGQVLVV